MSRSRREASHFLTELVSAFGPEKAGIDAASRRVYSVDASIYRVDPGAVLVAENETDVVRALAFCRERGIPLTARTAGTNLTGNAVGSGIILELSRMGRLLSVDKERREARAEPGLVCAELDRDLEPHGLMFAPDPSSGDVCRIGGMIANNSAGPRTVKYGAVKDNLSSLRVILPDGAAIEARSFALDEPEFRRLLAERPEIRTAFDIVRDNAALIRSRRIGVSKNSAGYNLFDLADGIAAGRFDLHKLFVGSEGTLGIVTEAALRLVPRPVRTATVLIFFRRLAEIGPAVGRILSLRPSALEMLDGNTLDLIGRDRFDVPADARAMLLVDLDQEPIEEVARVLDGIVRGYDLAAPAQMGTDPEARSLLWRARKAIYPTLYRYGGGRKPINFVDDVVVAAERLPELIEYLEEYFRGINVPVALYGHIGDGNAHINPLLNLADAADFRKMIRIYGEIHRIVTTKFGGSICGEHGDGRVRAEFLRDLYGPQVYDLFVRIKRAFDPDNFLNPGIKLSDVPFTESIDVPRLVKPCATCGKCNTVCPVYDVRTTEKMGARGWYTLLTDISLAEEAEPVVAACLNCKSCRAVCPAGVDVSALVLERRARRPDPAIGRLFRLQAERPRLFEGLVKTAARTRLLWDNRPGRTAVEALSRFYLRDLGPRARIPREMVLPPLARRTLRERFRPLTEERGAKGRIAYFHGCAGNLFDDGVGDATIALLRRFGAEPVLPRQVCSGTPIETYGHVDLLRDRARINIESLLRYETVVTACASCTLSLREYERLFEDIAWRERARELAGKVRHVTEYLLDDMNAPPPAAGVSFGRVTYHSSCHMRAAGVTRQPRELLRRIPGVQFVEMRDADRCAGGAGTYGMKDPETSAAIFERKRRGVEESGADVVATSCPACMIQLNNGLKGSRRVMHVVQVLAEAYGLASAAGDP
ncbi:MAG: FAD-binding oxidoreductase [Nitrospirae bacterium]|nr:FAD-binding oxidoreductase [Nitrospirota bacterium]